MSFITNFGYASICGLGMLYVLKGWADIGTVLAFLIYVKMFTAPINELA